MQYVPDLMSLRVPASHPAWAGTVSISPEQAHPVSKPNTLTMGNLHICYKAFFAGKFVWYHSQVSDALHDFVPERRQLIRAIQVPNNIWWYSKDDVVKFQLCPGWGGCAQQWPISWCCHTWREQRDGSVQNWAMSYYTTSLLNLVCGIVSYIFNGHLLNCNYFTWIVPVHKWCLMTTNEIAFDLEQYVLSYTALNPKTTIFIPYPRLPFTPMNTHPPQTHQIYNMAQVQPSALWPLPLSLVFWVGPQRRWVPPTGSTPASSLRLQEIAHEHMVLSSAL